MSFATPNSALVNPNAWHAGFLAAMPLIQTNAQIHFRHLRPERREKAVQEAIASACKSYRELAAKGRLHDAHRTTLARFVVNHVRNGRYVGGSQDSARDAMSPRAQSRYRFQTQSIDRYDSKIRGWRQIAVEDRKTSIPDLVAFRIDFAQMAQIPNPSSPPHHRDIDQWSRDLGGGKAVWPGRPGSADPQVDRRLLERPG